MAHEHDIFKHIELISSFLPTPIWWYDINFVLKGLNNNIFPLSINPKFSETVINKTPYDLYPYKIAHTTVQNLKKVLNTKTQVIYEDVITDQKAKKTLHVHVTMSPLHDINGEIAGVICISKDITPEKEIQQLKIENDHYKTENKVQCEKMQIEEQQKFQKVLSQMLHDIKSPLSTLQVLITSEHIPEKQRLLLRAISANINDLLNQSLQKYTNMHSKLHLKSGQPILLINTLTHLVNEQMNCYQNSPIEFKYHISPEANLAFIKTESSMFRRAISNIIDNAVAAFNNSSTCEKRKESPHIKIKLDADTEWVLITIEDNGCGISKTNLDVIRKNINSADSNTNSPLHEGLAQVGEVLRQSFAKFIIYSTEGYGTKIILKFPKISVPTWIADTIYLIKDDIVIILDDDKYIHEAWDSRFSSIIENNPLIKLKHFTYGTDLINFVNSISPFDKQRLFFLIDFELLSQKHNGLEILELIGISRAILVTSHYDNLEICRFAAKLKIKILPKELAFVVKIKVDKKITPGSKKVDMVFMDDQKIFVDSLVAHYYNHLNVDIYYDPVTFLENIIQYPVDTKIILDNYYNESDIYDIDGLTIAKQLHQMGYYNLFMLSGEKISKKLVPEYLTVLLKSNIDSIKNLDRL